MDPGATDTMARGAPPDLGTDADRALLDLAVEMVVAENRARAARLQAISDFHDRRVAEVEAHAAGRTGPWDGVPGYFLLTPLEATKVELAPLLGMSELYLQLDLDLVEDLRCWLPQIWRRCGEGRLDLGRAAAMRDQLSKLADDRARTAYAEEVQAWVDKNDDPDQPLFRLSHQAVRRAARRISLRHPQKPPDESFADAFKKRRVTLSVGEDGVGSLSCVTAVHDLLRADHRLTLIAKKRREVEGEQRTIAQLRADTLIDLVHGRLTVPARDGELEEDCRAGSGCAEHEDGDDEAGCADPAGAFDWTAVGQFARPIVNVTVPITTLMGLNEEGGMLSGGIPIPAELARRIAVDPDSVWYRMLTDSEGRFLELSTESYTPNGVIWRWTAARDVQCVYPGCSHPATVVELDHRVPWPQGRTTTWNIQPLCKRHHKVKHSLGFTVVREVDGSYTWTTRFGSVLRRPSPDHPLADVDETLRGLLFGPAASSEQDVPASSDRDASGVFDRDVAIGSQDDVDVPWFDFCLDDEDCSVVHGEHGDEFEVAFREWFDREVVGMPLGGSR